MWCFTPYRQYISYIVAATIIEKISILTFSNHIIPGFFSPEGPSGINTRSLKSKERENVNVSDDHLAEKEKIELETVLKEFITLMIKTVTSQKNGIGFFKNTLFS